ncbi:MAG TPA: hypothetical protein VLW85_14435 [Myxococcales bacterium]|nr:hypothetical protein [Myxococcales bacterium]
MDVRLLVALLFGACSGNPPAAHQPVALANGQFAPCGIAAAGGNVFFTTGNGALLRVAASGGEPQLLALAQDHPCDIATDGERVFWANYSTDGSISSLPIAGGTPAVLAQGLRGPAGLTLFDGVLHWVEVTGASVSRMPAGGGDVEVLATEESTPAALAVGPDAIYWSSVGKHSIRLLRGGSVATLATDQDAPIAMRFRNGVLYWINDGDGRVFAARPGADPQVIALTQHPDGLAVDDTNVYVSDESTILRVGLGGENPTVIASDQLAPGEMAVDDDNVYWVNTNPSGTVMKLAKR